MNPLAAAYGRAAAWRRAWYTRHPERRARLSRPVVSIGNLVVGGSGKTPLAAHVAEVLVDAGLRPAILSRGYGRRTVTSRPLVVSDGAQVLVPVEESGDEPMMLARLLPDVPVVVCARRADAGRLAVERFDADVLLLDDGFQHLELQRDVDVLVVSPEDLDAVPLPAGPLREPLDAVRAADAIVVPGTEDDAARVSRVLGFTPAFAMSRHVGRARLLSDAGSVGPGRHLELAAGAVGPELRLKEDDRGAGPADPPSGPVFLVAGIARPERFVSAVKELGLTVAGEMRFRDHHWFTRYDIARIERAARDRGAVCIVTTEKDAVRVEGLSRTLPWARVPLRVEVSRPRFGTWLLERLATLRGHRTAGGRQAR